MRVAVALLLGGGRVRVGRAVAVGVAVLMTLVAMIMRMAVVFMAVAASNVGNLPSTIVIVRFAGDRWQL